MANQEEINRENLLRDRLEFRRLLQKYHLLDLVGDENECAEWLEVKVIELVYWISKRQRLRELLRQGKEMLKREREGEQHLEDLTNGESEKKPHPPSARRYRRFNISQS